MIMNPGKDLHEYIVSTTGTYMSLSTRTRTKILLVDLSLHPTFYLVHIYFDITTVFVKVLCYIELSFK